MCVYVRVGTLAEALDVSDIESRNHAMFRLLLRVDVPLEEPLGLEHIILPCLLIFLFLPVTRRPLFLFPGHERTVAVPSQLKQTVDFLIVSRAGSRQHPRFITEARAGRGARYSR